jgi:hypothetical protein
VRRLAPTARPLPAMTGASVSAGFVDIDRAGGRFADDPYAADDPDGSDA